MTTKLCLKAQRGGNDTVFQKILPIRSVPRVLSVTFVTPRSLGSGLCLLACRQAGRVVVSGQNSKERGGAIFEMGSSERFERELISLTKE